MRVGRVLVFWSQLAPRVSVWPGYWLRASRSVSFRWKYYNATDAFGSFSRFSAHRPFLTAGSAPRAVGVAGSPCETHASRRCDNARPVRRVETIPREISAPFRPFDGRRRAGTVFGTVVAVSRLEICAAGVAPGVRDDREIHNTRLENGIPVDSGRFVWCTYLRLGKWTKANNFFVEILIPNSSNGVRTLRWLKPSSRWTVFFLFFLSTLIACLRSWNCTRFVDGCGTLLVA